MAKVTGIGGTHFVLLVFALSLAFSSCNFAGFQFRREIRAETSISDLTVSGDYLYFGAGYSLYRLHVPTRQIEKIYSTDRLVVEQPIVADGNVYFGGTSGVSKDGRYGESEGFFAVNPENGRRLWKFALGVGGYGTFGTYPALADDGILVCAREYVHYLDRRSGEERWRIENWMGRVGDGVTIPYVYKQNAYFQIAEEHIAGTKRSDENDGHWAEVNINSGHRAIFPIAENPGTYEDSSGTGFGSLVDGVIYGKTRVDFFGALSLDDKKVLWEVPGKNLSRPAVNDKFVFTSVDNEVYALDRKNGTARWHVPLENIAKTNIDRSVDRRKWYYENYWSPRFALAKEILFVQGSQGIVALNVNNGETLWFKKRVVEFNHVNPVIHDNELVTVSDVECSIFALDALTGTETWRVQIPDCTTYQVIDS